MKTLQDILSAALQELQARAGTGPRSDTAQDLNAVVEALSTVVQRRMGEIVCEAVSQNNAGQLRILGFLDSEIATLKTLTPLQVIRLFKRAPLPVVKLTLSQPLLALCLDLLQSGKSNEEIKATLERLKPRLVLNQRSAYQH